MKLKLNSESEIARKIAMCFVGSEIEDSYGCTSLIGVSSHEFIRLFELNRSMNCIGVSKAIQVVIGLDTAKFDPFVAMREGLFVKDSETGEHGTISETDGSTFEFWNGKDKYVRTRNIELSSVYANSEGVEFIE